MTAPLTYLTTLDLDDSWLEALAQRCPELEIRCIPAAAPAEIADDVWASVDILHTGDVFPLPRQAPRLRWIQLDTSGVEHVRAHPIWDTDTVITTLGGIAPVPMAEFTVMSLLSLAHHQPRLNDLRRQHLWPSGAERLATLTPLPVDGATATVVGYGRIGREVARLLHAFGLNVIGVRRRGTAAAPPEQLQYDTGRGPAAEGVVEVQSIDELDEILPRTDYLIVIVPRTAATVGLLGADQLARLKPGACLVDVSRGGVVVESALLAALRSGHVRYASLDVFEDEPLSEESAWWDEPNCLVTPHVAGLAPRYREQVLTLLSTNIVRYQEGQPLLNRADRATGY